MRNVNWHVQHKMNVNKNDYDNAIRINQVVDHPYNTSAQTGSVKWNADKNELV